MHRSSVNDLASHVDFFVKSYYMICMLEGSQWLAFQALVAELNNSSGSMDVFVYLVFQAVTPE